MKDEYFDTFVFDCFLFAHLSQCSCYKLADTWASVSEQTIGKALQKQKQHRESQSQDEAKKTNLESLLSEKS